MITRRPPRFNQGKKVFMELSDFSGGVNNSVSETRLKETEAKEATNLVLDEDGVWKKRWGTQQYGGVSYTNTIDGFGEYRKSATDRELIVVADGKVYELDPSTETSTEISGATFTQGTRVDMVQIGDNLYICNGTDNLARYNGTNLTSYSSIDTPTWDGTPLSRGAGLGAGSYNYYYRVSAVNAIGETLAAAEETITVDIDRDDWDEADEYIQLDWGDVAGALKYVIYFGDTTGYLNKLTEVSVSTFQDDGSLTPNTYVEPPTADTTDGPKFTSIAVSGNRLWGTGDPDAPQRVYFSGTGVNLGNFSPAYGGGWVDLETGSRQEAVKVIDYQGEAHVFCKTAEGRGSIWRVDLTTTSVGDTTVIVPVPEKLIAQKGTPASRSVAHVENDIYFMNERGVHVLGDEVGVLNRLRTNELSGKIRPYINSLYEPDIDKCASYYYDAKVFFSVSLSSGEPGRTIVYDREHKSWMVDWSVGVSQWGEYTDNSGNTHLLGIDGTKLVEFNSSFESDQGTAFTWRYVSPRFSVADDWSQYARIKRMYVRLRDTVGNIDFTVRGTLRNGLTSSLASDTISPGNTQSGIGWDPIGSVRLGTTDGEITTFSLESLLRFIEVRKLVREIQWEISGDGISDRAVITGLMAEGNLVGVAKPESWRLD